MRTPHAALLSLVALPWLACKASAPDTAEVPATGGAAPQASHPMDSLALGARLYADHCSVCHGERGRGDGPASAILFPRARDFTRGSFRLVRTENGVPTREDLVATLQRGVPGSAMPAWQWMAPDELDALAVFVEHLSVRGLAYDLLLAGRSDEEAMAEAREFFTPGAVLPAAAELEPSEQLLAEGRQLYLASCASCHGDDGAGRAEPRFDEDGGLNWPRDFTAGYLKGGRGASELGWRVQAGMPGTAMPGMDLETGELDALVTYLRDLIPPGAETNRVQRRERILARRVDTLPGAAREAGWEGLEETSVVLTPLDAARTADGITRAYACAVHDGDSVALRLRWRDETGNLRAYSDLAGPDGCALQFSTAESPRFFGMGSTAERTNIWHWKALRHAEVAGALDLIDPPHVFAETFRGEVRTDVPLYRPNASLPGTSETVDSLRAGGVGALATPGGGDGESPVHAQATWVDGEWRVVFTRSCVVSASTAVGEVPLRPGGQLNVALAIWNGAAGDRGARKSISIWQQLELEP